MKLTQQQINKYPNYSMGGCLKCGKGFITTQKNNVLEKLVFDYFKVETLFEVTRSFCSNVMCLRIKSYTDIISKETT